MLTLVENTGSKPDTSKTELWLVNQAEINHLDFQTIKLINQAVDYEKTHSVSDVLQDLRRGSAQLWLATDDNVVEGIAVTVINDHPQCSTLLIWLCAGIEHEKYTPHICNIEDWAREQGCQKVSLEGRPGWEKVLGDYEKTKIYLEKVI